MAAAQAEAERTGNDADLKYYVEKSKDTRCIGSQCMAWRPVMEAPGLNVSTHSVTGMDAKGYCGLAYAVRLP